MKQKLETNRELGGDFEISEENTKKILEVTEDGQLIFSTVTIEKKNKIPIDTSNISFFRYLNSFVNSKKKYLKNNSQIELN